MTKLKVPEGMGRAATNAIVDLWDGQPSHWNPSTDKRTIALAAVEAALWWLSENPIVPTDAQWQELREWDHHTSNFDTFFRHVLAEWQRRMFLPPEPEIPEEIKDLVLERKQYSLDIDKFNAGILEAYRRGKGDR